MIGFFFGVFLTVFLFGLVQGNKGAMIIGSWFLGGMVLSFTLGDLLYRNTGDWWNLILVVAWLALFVIIVCLMELWGPKDSE